MSSPDWDPFDRLHLLDADVLIHAASYYYRFEQVPEFWDWLLDRGEAGLARTIHQRQKRESRLGE